MLKNHSPSAIIWKHEKLPILKTKEFDFFRCVKAGDWVYGKTVSILHEGNLRDNDHKGRYSKLFPDEKISYWADSKSTALAEIKRHSQEENKNYLTFWAYDDLSSTFPTIDNKEELVIIDGIEIGFSDIMKKVEENKKLTDKEEKIIEEIKRERPDCLAYQSKARPKNINFLFFEKGFRKLSLKQVQLYLGERKSKNTNRIDCAQSCDYSPILESYGCCFQKIARIGKDNGYRNTEEFKNRYINLKKAWNV